MFLVSNRGEQLPLDPPTRRLGCFAVPANRPRFAIDHYNGRDAALHRQRVVQRLQRDVKAKPFPATGNRAGAGEPSWPVGDADPVDLLAGSSGGLLIQDRPAVSPDDGGYFLRHAVSHVFDQTKQRRPKFTFHATYSDLITGGEPDRELLF